MGTIFRRHLRLPERLEKLRAESIVPEAEHIGMFAQGGKLLGHIWIVPRCSGKVWFVAYIEGREMLKNLSDFLALAKANNVRLVEMHAATAGMAAWATRKGWQACGCGDFARIV